MIDDRDPFSFFARSDALPVLERLGHDFGETHVSIKGTLFGVPVEMWVSKKLLPPLSADGDFNIADVLLAIPATPAAGEAA